MDPVTHLLTLLEAAPRESWERVIRQEFGGRHLYISAATGRQALRDLVGYGVAARTARWKVRAR